jgi:L-threonine kinase
VSCPIDAGSVARVCRIDGPNWDVPRDRPKTVAGLRSGMRYLGRSGSLRLRLRSTLPPGRGYGTSTADLGAALYALGHACDHPLQPGEVARLAVEIEPTDSSLLPGLTLLAHRTAHFHEVLGSAPPLFVLAIDPGGRVDTVSFNKADHRLALRRLASAHREAFDLLRVSLSCGDWRGLGEAATLSARLHHGILPNPWLDDACHLSAAVRGLGVCRAHSGTLLGILLDGDAAGAASALDFVVRHLPPNLSVRLYRLCDGGPHEPLSMDGSPLAQVTQNRPTLLKHGHGHRGDGGP